MRAALKALSRQIPLGLDRIRIGLGLLARTVLRAWKWFNGLDLPLSPLQWLLGFYVVFGLAYALVNPTFEAHDELWHFGYIQHLREAGELPIQVFDGSDTIYAQHGSQAPLYYALMALVSSAIDIDDIETYRQLNPHVALNRPDSFGNKNIIIHDEDHSIVKGTGLAVLIIRLFGLAMGAGTIVLIYRIGSFVAPQRPTVAFVAGAMAGLNPMFIFVSASVNNDTLAMLLNGGVALLLLQCLRDGFGVRTSLSSGLLFTLSSLSKLTALVLAPVLIGAGIVIYARGRDKRGALIYILSLVLFWLAIAGWWYLRNWELYGEPFGMTMMANIAGPRGMSFSPVSLLVEFQQFRMSFWGLFGAQNVAFASIVYLLLDLATFFSIVGCIFLILQLLAISDFAYARYELRNLLTLLCVIALLLAGVVYWNTLTRSSDGRVLFPLIAVISPVLAVGFVESVWWIVFSLRPPNLEFVRAGDAVPKELLHETMLWHLRFLGIVAIVAPFTVIASQYSPPAPVEDVPDKARPVYAEFEDVALVAYERINRRYSPGDRVRVKLYWKVLEQSARDKSILLSMLDDNQQVIGGYASYPGAGSLRTSRWEIGRIYPDEYLIPIHVGASGRYPFDLRVEWTDLAEAGMVVAKNAEGESIEPVLLNIGAVASLQPQQLLTGFHEIPEDMQPNFEDSIRLQHFLLDEERNELVLHWRAETSPADDYTVFVHVLDDTGAIIAQADIPPRLPTGYWRWGESYSTYHQFEEGLQLLEQTVLVGWYLNDGKTYPKTEYRIEDEEGGEEFRDSFPLPWDILIENMRLTQEAQATAASETSEASTGDESTGTMAAPEEISIEPATEAASEASGN